MQKYIKKMILSARAGNSHMRKLFLLFHGLGNASVFKQAPGAASFRGAVFPREKMNRAKAEIPAYFHAQPHLPKYLNMEITRIAKNFG